MIVLFQPFRIHSCTQIQYGFLLFQKMTVSISPKHDVATDDNDNETCCTDAKVSELDFSFTSVYVSQLKVKSVVKFYGLFLFMQVPTPFFLTCFVFLQLLLFNL